MSTIPHFDHSKIDQGIGAFADFAEVIGRSDLADPVNPLVARYRAGLYRLVLVGEEKRGKSSLLSALLGHPELLPAGPEPMTACVFKIIYGPEMQHRVFFLPKDPDDPDRSRPEPRNVSPREVAEYGTEAGNPDNSRGVDFIAVEYPDPLLKAGLTIVDLPGLGGLKREHGLLTLSYLPNADAAFFVVDSVVGSLTAAELGTLDRLRGFTNHIIFVQTKIDAVSTDQWERWRDRNLENIAKRLAVPPGELSYFPVSNVLKHDFDRTGDEQDLEDSGFPPLIRLLEEDLIPRKHDRLAMPLVDAIIGKTAAAAQSIENELSILETSSKEELERIEADLLQAQRDYAGWKASTLPGLIQGFKDEFRAAEIEADRAISRDLNSSDRGPIVGPILARVENDASLTAADIASDSGNLNDDAVHRCGDRLDQIGKTFDRRTMDAFEHAAKEINAAVKPLNVQDSSYQADLSFERIGLRTQSSPWGTMMQGRLGLISGAMIAGAVASLVFAPLSLAVAAVSLLGGLFGARRSIKEARQRERIQAEGQLRMLLTDTVRRLQQHGLRECRVAFETRRKPMLDALQESVKQRDHDEKVAMAAVRDKRRQTKEQTEARVQVLRRQLDQASAVVQLLHEAGATDRDEEGPGAG